MKMKTAELAGRALDWAVAKAEGHDVAIAEGTGQVVIRRQLVVDYFDPSTNWGWGGPIIEHQNVTVIRADDTYEVDEKGFTTSKRIPQWFAETSRWVGHSLTTSYEGEQMEPTFMIAEQAGYYGPTPLVAAMRCYVASKFGAEVDVPETAL
jgi:hypothetical protein